LVTATRDVDHSGAAVLLDALRGRPSGTRGGRSTEN
jgi:hypothetical protein